MRTRCGLTLIEVLVLIAIIMILAALFLPIFKSSNESARRTTCASHLHQIGKAMFMYADVPANGMFPTCSKTPDPFADTTPMQALNLLYGSEYIASWKCFSCPSKPVPHSALLNVERTVKGSLAPGGPYLSATSCSYGYDPGHSASDTLTVIAADRKGVGQNSDNHGANAGQNVVLVSGATEFRDTTAQSLGIDKSGKPVEDADIYSLSTNTRVTRKLDAHIRQ